MSEKDLEHHASVTNEKEDRNSSTYDHASASPPVLPTISRASRSSKGSISFEQFREDGFVEIDLERQIGTETTTTSDRIEPKDRRKPRLILFN